MKHTTTKKARPGAENSRQTAKSTRIPVKLTLVSISDAPDAPALHPNSKSEPTNRVLAGFWSKIGISN
jgi:hypothetical protein